MRIAIVSDYYYPQLGGITEHVHGQATELTRRGHDVTLVTSRLTVRPSTAIDEALPPRTFELARIARAWPFYANGVRDAAVAGRADGTDPAPAPAHARAVRRGARAQPGRPVPARSRHVVVASSRDRRHDAQRRSRRVPPAARRAPGGCVRAPAPRRADRRVAGGRGIVVAVFPGARLDRGAERGRHRFLLAGRRAPRLGAGQAHDRFRRPLRPAQRGAAHDRCVHAAAPDARRCAPRHRRRRPAAADRRADGPCEAAQRRATSRGA